MITAGDSELLAIRNSRVQKNVFLWCKANSLLEQLRDEFTPSGAVVTDVNGETRHSGEGCEN
jgi:hypothetical protein